MGAKKYSLLFLLVPILLLGVVFPSRQAEAFGIPGLSSITGAATVPTTSVIQDFIKTVLNTFAHAAARTAVSHLVTSTVTWANSGFEGNPVYVTNPKQFFADTANQSADAFIRKVGDGKLGFLCSPFQKQIQLSLIQYYYQPQNQQFQCTWTGIASNLQDFMNGNFSAGGWDGFISMTQIPTNNVYGAGITAQIAMSSQIAAAVGLQQQTYQINQGFLNIPGDCLQKNPTAQQITDYENGVSGPGTIASGNVPYDDTKPAGACISYAPTRTPGTIIQSELEKTLGAQTDQIINAQDWDQVVSALVNGLTKRIFNAATGLFNNNPTEGIATGNEQPDGVTDADVKNSTTPAGPQTATCTAAPTAVGINQPSTMTASISNVLPTDVITYSWSEDGNTNKTKSISYTAPGTYPQSVTVALNGVQQIAQCPSIVVTAVPPLSVSCSPRQSSAPTGSSVTWNAQVSGGSGTVANAAWMDESSGLSGDTSNESWSSNNMSASGGTTFITSSITYHASGQRQAAITVVDANASTTPVSALCSGYVQVGDGSPTQI